jgi:hypothetical protein
MFSKIPGIKKKKPGSCPTPAGFHAAHFAKNAKKDGLSRISCISFSANPRFWPDREKGDACFPVHAAPFGQMGKI